jgi:hypothetical protein
MVAISHFVVLHDTEVGNEVGPFNPVHVVGYEMILACKDKVQSVLDEESIASQESHCNFAVKGYGCISSLEKLTIVRQLRG